MSVSRTPGHTKYFQTYYLTPTVKLCDCPGLVFPSRVNKQLQVEAHFCVLESRCDCEFACTIRLGRNIIVLSRTLSHLRRWIIDFTHSSVLVTSLQDFFVIDAFIFKTAFSCYLAVIKKFLQPIFICSY